MKLSVVIVNYNVEHFLEQCLNSVEKAISGIDAEVWVVDNNSVDGSLVMLSQKFPWVHCIANTQNVGFSRANNQAIRVAKGEYVLLLNPDTIVEVDTFSKTISYMDSHADIGGLGVKMVDGKGNFLPESKRGLPTPEVAFYKIFGLSKFFKKSKRFGKYHLTYLDKDQTNEVDVLSGAFMLMRAETLVKVGLLDEDYFMYGEDIDLSYRITKGGYKNIYFADTTIIHYKGESTKKGSLNYVFVFYNAMRIFARKHFSGQSKHFFIFLINFAIYLRASMSIAKRFIQRVWLPVLDFVLVYSSMIVLKNYWESVALFHKSNHFPDEFIQIAVPVYMLIWFIAVYFMGGYSKQSRPSKIVKGVLSGTLFILVMYALLPENLRYSRAMIALGAATVMVDMVGVRLILNYLGLYKFTFGDNQTRRFLVVGNIEEGKRVVDVLRRTNLNPDYIGLITPERSNEGVGTLSQISEIVSIYKINEVVFCSKDLTANEIIDLMGKLHSHQLEYKIAPQGSLSIIGSSSINRSGDIYVIDINAITSRKNRRNKRLFDVVASLILFLLFPIFIWFSNPFTYLKHIALVFIGKMSWVGLNPSISYEHNALKKGVFYPTDGLKIGALTDDLVEKANQVYTSDYKVGNDFSILGKSLLKIGRKLSC